MTQSDRMEREPEKKEERKMVREPDRHTENRTRVRIEFMFPKRMCPCMVK